MLFKPWIETGNGGTYVHHEGSTSSRPEFIPGPGSQIRESTASYLNACLQAAQVHATLALVAHQQGDRNVCTDQFEKAKQFLAEVEEKS